MNMKNDLINSINTKVSAPDMKYSELITSGANTLDEAFKPYKNTNDIISLNTELDRIRGQQALKMEALAQQEQNKMAIDALNKKFESDNKAIKEAGANLFTYGGTKLDGTEETYIQDIMKDFEKQTGRKDFNIDDVIRNVNDSQLALSSDLKDRINKYSDYKYNKAKIDNRMLDSNDINKLAEEYYPQFGMIGQDQNSFKTLFSNNSNSFADIIKDKENKNRFIIANSGIDMEKEKIRELLEKMSNVDNENIQNNESNSVKLRIENNESNSKNNSQKLNNKQNEIKQNKVEQKNYPVDYDLGIKSDLYNDKNMQKMYDFITENPENQKILIDYLVDLTGIRQDFKEDIKSRDLRNSSKTTPHKRFVDVIDKGFLNDDYKLISDVFSYANNGNLFKLDLDEYDYEDLGVGEKGLYDTIKKLQDKYDRRFDKGYQEVFEIAKNPKYFTTNAHNNLELDKNYIDLGKTLMEEDSKLEGIINPNKDNDGIYQKNNGYHWWLPDAETRDLHQSKLDRQFLESNNIIANSYDSSTDPSIVQTVYFLITSDSVIKEREKYINFNNKNKPLLANRMKDSEERKIVIKEIKEALKKANQNLKTPLGTDLPFFDDLAKIIALTDSAIMPNIGNLRKNPYALGLSAKTIYNTVNENNLANILNYNK